MENEENQTQVFLRFPTPLEIAKARFPHSLNPGNDRRGKVEIQKQDSHFPTAALGFFKDKQRLRKEDAPERRLRRRSGSSLD